MVFYVINSTPAITVNSLASTPSLLPSPKLTALPIADSSSDKQIEAQAKIQIETPENPSGGLSEAQKSSLKALGIPIVIPLYVPNGFKIFEITTKTVPFSNADTASAYDLVYINAQNTCLLVSGQDARIGGFGGPDSEFVFRTHTALLGDVDIEFGGVPGDAKTPTPQQLRIPQPQLGIWPVEKVPSLDISIDITTSDEYLSSTYPGCSEKNTSITPLELEKVIQSMVLLK